MVSKKELMSWGYYDKIATRYDIKHGVAMPGGIYSIKNSYTPILEKYITKNDRVLEIGCGTGAITEIIKGLCRELKASDVSKNMLEVAKQKIKSVEFSIADTQELPFNDGVFTVVVGINPFLPR